jgi:glutathione S-transferase
MITIPTVFWVSGSPYSWRVLLALEAKRVGYSSQLLTTEKGDLENPGFRRLSPRGCVPALQDGDVILTGSLAILAYIDRKYPDCPLFGSSAGEAGEIWREVLEFTEYVEPFSRGIVKSPYAGEAQERFTEISEYVVKVHTELARIEVGVGQGPWFKGDRLTAVDVAIYPFLKSLFRAVAKPEAQPLDLHLLPRASLFPKRWLLSGTNASELITSVPFS